MYNIKITEHVKETRRIDYVKFAKICENLGLVDRISEVHYSQFLNEVSHIRNLTTELINEIATYINKYTGKSVIEVCNEIALYSDTRFEKKKGITVYEEIIRSDF